MDFLFYFKCIFNVTIYFYFFRYVFAAHLGPKDSFFYERVGGNLLNIKRLWHLVTDVPTKLDVQSAVLLAVDARGVIWAMSQCSVKDAVKGTSLCLLTC